MIGDPEYMVGGRSWFGFREISSGPARFLPQRLKIVLYGTITAASGAAEDTPRGHLFATGARLELLGGSSDPLSNAFAFMAAVAVVALLISL